MARGGKSALSAGASPVPHAAAKKRKSEALLKDLLGVATQDDGPVRPNSAALRHAMLLFGARGFAAPCCCHSAAQCCFSPPEALRPCLCHVQRLTTFAAAALQLETTPSEPARGVRPKTAATPGDLEGSLLRALAEHTNRSKERAKAQVEEELGATAALVEAELKALSHSLAAADEDEAALRRSQLKKLAAEAAAARADMDKALTAFKKVSADKLAQLQRVRAKVAEMEKADATHPAPNKAEIDKV